jgi:hypothetical protein
MPDEKEQRWEELARLFGAQPKEKRQRILRGFIEYREGDKNHRLQTILLLEGVLQGALPTMNGGSQEYDDILAGQEIYSGLQED